MTAERRNRSRPAGAQAAAGTSTLGIVAERGRASDRVLEELREMILTLQLAPGAVITEASLVEIMGCSRTPLREALQRLVYEHLVVAVPRRGVSVADLSLVDFGPIVEAFECVDSVTVRLAAERLSDEVLDELDGVLRESDEAEAAGDLARVVGLDFRFHTTFGAVAGNPFLLEFQEMLLHLLARFVYLGFARAGTAAGAIADHRRIVAALQARDADAAETAVRDHCHNGRERMRVAL
ncbi:MAG TPA: GntR family transcriptional regulator [Thermoleophilia bacterium]|nr:GntR family transcriptional regulator [Thermoleophilia bacterium]